MEDDAVRKHRKYAATAVFAITTFLAAGFIGARQSGGDTPAGINWVTFEEAVKLNKKKPRKIVIDFYTTWCGWCKRMDATTFSDPAIIKYVNEHFYAVKFNAEQQDSMVFNNHVFKFIPPPQGGRRGINEFAMSALDGRPSYPSLVFFDEKINRIGIKPGYRDPGSMESLLNWVKENEYLKRSWEDFHRDFLARKAGGGTATE